MPLAAALYGRPERDRPRWLFDIVVLDLVLIALFAAFRLHLLRRHDRRSPTGRRGSYNANLRQLLNARNLLLAVWATWVWRTAPSPRVAAHARHLCRRPGADLRRRHHQRRGRHRRIVTAGSALGPRLHGAVRRDAAAPRRRPTTPKLFEPEDEAPALSRLPMVSLIAISAADRDSGHRRGRAAVARRVACRPSRCGRAWRWR